MNNIQGIAASPGIAIAKAYRLITPDLSFNHRKTKHPEKEVERLKDALNRSIQEIEKIKAHTLEELGEEHAEIFSAHLLILKDQEFIQPIQEKITAEEATAEAAVEEVSDMFIEIFQNMDDEYMRERAADIKDVTKRILAHLLGVTLPNPKLIDEEVIIIADDLTPSDTAQLNLQYVKGFVTNIGGRTSHSAIMARSLEIPAVVGTKEITTSASQDDLIIIDGNEGIVIVQP
ncbi:PEP-utilizing enzyme, partial [Candidatus Pseudothioglobus singularis]|nr:PEP-utilizing enzyme [Candidatus Pseudothioglobus singularis]